MKNTIRVKWKKSRKIFKHQILLNMNDLTKYVRNAVSWNWNFSIASEFFCAAKIPTAVFWLPVSSIKKNVMYDATSVQFQYSVLSQANAN